MKILYKTKIWQYRELFYFLTLRDIKVRYRQAVLGFGWAVISPVVLALVFWLVFGVFLKVHSGPIPYLLLIFSKLTFWNFFSQTLSAAAASLTGNSNLISKSAFPREILVLSSVSVRIVDLSAAVVVLAALMFFYKIGVSFQVFWLIPIVALEIILVIGLGLVVASLNVYFRDIAALLPLLMTAWLFVTPVIYTLDSVPKNFQILLFLNPMTGIIEGIRSSLLLHRPPDLTALAFSTVAAITVFILGYIIFKKIEKGFADVI